MTATFVMAVATATYRGVVIWETQEGCSIFLGRKQYDFAALEEATAFIDAAYAIILAPA